MSEANPCPYCGCPQPETPAARQPSGYANAIDGLSREVQRIRDIAEARAVDGDRRRIEELTSEVQHLRATVARLRGVPDPCLTRPDARLPRPA